MKGIKNYSGFFGSVFSGILIWIIAYSLVPASAIEPLKTETILFILSCYISLVIGFLAFNFKPVSKTYKKLSTPDLINILVLIIFVCYLLRWYDLFFIRELSFSHQPKYNRTLNNLNLKNSNIFLILASIVKGAYFFPFVIALISKLKMKSWPVIFSFLLMLLPTIEAILKGTRKPFFEIFLIVLITWILYRVSKINFTKIATVFFGFFILMTISVVVLVNRESEFIEKDNNFFDLILDSRYNDILKPKDAVIKYFKNPNTPEFLKYYALITLQSGQYISHGVFEFNHIIKNNDLPITNGTYTFNTIPKLTNRIGLYKLDVINPSPRSYVYLTAFGALYIDFRWASLVVIFFFGVFQKYAYQKSTQLIIYTPILIYLLLINVFLPIINYISGTGIYPIIGFLLIIIFMKLLQIFSKGKYKTF